VIVDDDKKPVGTVEDGDAVVSSLWAETATLRHPKLAAVAGLVAAVSASVCRGGQHSERQSVALATYSLGHSQLD
jgi:hypothetical protein